MCVCVCDVTHLFEQGEDVNREETHGGGEHEAALLQVGHVTLVGAHQVHQRVHQRVTSVRQTGRYRPVDSWKITAWPLILTCLTSRLLWTEASVLLTRTLVCRLTAQCVGN